ncbi:MAG: hypothetical protein IIY52_08665 [Solobacterium sp.]|nr:hypothetical protein [Solobacterium sp.]
MKKKMMLFTAMVMLCICTLPGCGDADALVDSGFLNSRGWWFVLLSVNFFIIIVMLTFLRKLKRNLTEKPVASGSFTELCKKVIAMKIESENES